MHSSPITVAAIPSRQIEVVEYVKGIAIVLVVAAHLVKYQTLAAAPWYEVFKFKVYLFHMPLFMFVSGYVYFHTGAHEKTMGELAAYVAKRANRLLVPFFAIGAATLLGKMLMQHFSYVDEAPASLLDGLLSLFVNTEASPVLTIWYLYVLFIFSAATPFLFRLFFRRRLLLLVFAAGLYFIPTPDFLFANRVTGFYLFFIAGGIAQSVRYLDRLPSAAGSAALGLCFLALIAAPLDRFFGLLVCGIAAMAAVPALVRYCGRPALRFLHFCGRHSMVIYLFNVISIGVAKALFLRLSNYDASMFALLLAVTFTAGLFIPIGIKWITGISARTALIHKYIS